MSKGPLDGPFDRAAPAGRTEEAERTFSPCHVSRQLIDQRPDAHLYAAHGCLDRIATKVCDLSRNYREIWSSEGPRSGNVTVASAAERVRLRPVASGLLRWSR